jgi:hypothetical protein
VTTQFVCASDEWESRLRAAGLGTLAALLGAPTEGAAVAESRSSRTDRVSAAGTVLFRKVYRYPRLRDVLRGALRGTVLGRPRAEREWRALMTLRPDGLPAVEPVALVVRRALGVVRETVLVTREEDGARPATRAITGGDKELIERGLASVARTIARAHARDHVLGRPALRDVLLGPDGAEAFLLDLPRHRRGRVGTSLAAEDLGRLAAGIEIRGGRDAVGLLLREYVAERRDARVDLVELGRLVSAQVERWREGEVRRVRG